jgi:hypothetical protein
MAIFTVFDILRQSTSEAHSQSSVGVLCAILVSMLNSLFVREPDRHDDIALREATGRRVLTDEDETLVNRLSASEPVQEDHGLFWLSDIWIEGRNKTYARVPELPLASETMASLGLWLRFFNETDWVSFQSNFPNALTQGGKRNPLRTKNRLQRMTIDVDLVQDPSQRAPAAGFDLSARGVVSTVPRKRQHDQPGYFGERRVRGRVIEFEDSDESEAEGAQAPALNPDDLIEKIWRQWPVDVFKVAANLKQARLGCHMHIPLALRDFVTTHWFKTTDLRGVFAQCRVRIGDHTLWDQAFEYYFPNTDVVLPTHQQHFTHLRYFNMWRRWTGLGLSQPHVNTVRRRLRKEFNTLTWVPAASRERVWNTRQDVAGEFFALPANLAAPAPVILVNPRAKVNKRDWRYGPVHPDHQGMILALRTGGQVDDEDAGQDSEDNGGRDNADGAGAV